MSTETELRLTFRPEDLPKLKNAAMPRSRARERIQTQRITSVLFDTADQQLCRQNILLEVRKRGDRYVQKVRANGSRINGVNVYKEWENPVPSEEPVLAAIADLDLRRLATPGNGADLVPAVRSDLNRTTRIRKFDEGEIAIQIDTGSMNAGTAAEPVAELTLRLRAGLPNLLFRFARELQEAIPLRVPPSGSNALAFSLLSGEEPKWRKSGKLEIDENGAVEDALISIVRHCLDHLQGNEECLLSSDHPEGVHQMRVAMRRLRSGLRNFRAVLPPGQYDHLVGELRWITKELADARDLDVFTEEIVGPVAERFPDAAGFERLNGRLAENRVEARAAAREAIASKRYARFVLDTRAWITDRAWRNQAVTEESAWLFRPISELSNVLLRKRFKKVRNMGRQFDELPEEERHQLRIEVKKLRYAVDFFSSLYGRGRVKAFVERMQKLQDGLGYMNDVVVAGSLLERLQNEENGPDGVHIREAAAFVLGWHTQAAVEAQKHLSEDVADFIASKPFWTG